MRVEEFEEYAEEFIKRERALRKEKTQEYVTSGDNGYMSAFENFVIQANFNGSRIEQEIWNNMVKHIASLKATIANNHTIPVEKIMDIRAYCLLLAAYAEINLPTHQLARETDYA